ncbi:MAG: hypothetical protein PGMFKBFP_01253 [Anaerolineales bacterium]|nr:hypothetical protein [Anaerolineales bacterium]
MLLLDYMAFYKADLYIEFIQSLSWFRMYCAGRFGKNKSDYLDGFETLETRYKDLWFDDEEEKNFSKYSPSSAEVMLDKVKKKLYSKRLEDKQIGEASSFLFNFLNNDENDFRTRYFDYQTDVLGDFDYPTELYQVVKELLKDEHPNEAVLNSFKFLDSHLQKIIGVNSHETYGEDLVNKAFALNTGLLQLGTATSEQAGLRNFFSGANAIFRNPSAHRFMKFEPFDAAAIVAMVAVMARMAIEISKKDSKKELS